MTESTNSTEKVTSRQAKDLEGNELKQFLKRKQQLVGNSNATDFKSIKVRLGLLPDCKVSLTPTKDGNTGEPRLDDAGKMWFQVYFKERDIMVYVHENTLDLIADQADDAIYDISYKERLSQKREVWYGVGTIVAYTSLLEDKERRQF